VHTSVAVVALVLSATVGVLWNLAEGATAAYDGCHIIVTFVFVETIVCCLCSVSFKFYVTRDLLNTKAFNPLITV
jgi:hypothetical protein